MRPCLASTQNVHEALGVLDVIETTRLQLLDASWRCRLDRHTYYHPCRTGVGADFLCYDPFARRNVSTEAGMNRVKVTCVAPSGIPNS